MLLSEEQMIQVIQADSVVSLLHPYETFYKFIVHTAYKVHMTHTV